MSSVGAGDARNGADDVGPEVADDAAARASPLSFRSDEIYQRIEMIGKGTYGSVYMPWPFFYRRPLLHCLTKLVFVSAL
jgi:hypothetical protein